MSHMDSFSHNFGVVERQTHGILMGCHGICWNSPHSKIYLYPPVIERDNGQSLINRLCSQL